MSCIIAMIIRGPIFASFMTNEKQKHTKIIILVDYFFRPFCWYDIAIINIYTEIT